MADPEGTLTELHSTVAPRLRGAGLRYTRSRRRVVEVLAGTDRPLTIPDILARAGTLPVVLFTAGGIATPADAAMMMQLGAEGVFVGSGIFKSGNPAQRAQAIVKATTFYDDPDTIAKVSRGLGEAMVGINVDDIPVPHRLAERGW